MWILLILWGLFVVFLLGPAIVATLTVFGRGREPGFDEACQTAQFAPYAAELRAARDAILARQPAAVSIAGPDEARLCADYVDLHADKTAILLHGYRAAPLLNTVVQAEAFADRGWNVLLVTQRAHGESGGSRSCLGLKEQYDLLRWADWALSQPGVETLAVYGVSMGAATAAYASDKLDPARVRALILDCGYLSPVSQLQKDCVRRHVPWRLLLPLIRLLARIVDGVDIQTPVTDALSGTTIPAFFLHGTNDETVPYAQGRAIYDACASEKAFFTAEGAAHTLAFPAERERAEQELFAFLERACSIAAADQDSGQ